MQTLEIGSPLFYVFIGTIVFLLLLIVFKIRKIAKPWRRLKFWIIWALTTFLICIVTTIMVMLYLQEVLFPDNITPESSYTGIHGNWYLNKWTSYHTLVFDDSTISVDNDIDIVFILSYTLSSDTLITWSEQNGKKYKKLILSLTEDSLIINGIHDLKEKRTYYRQNDLE